MIKPILSLIVIIISVSFAFLYVRPAYERLDTKKADLAMLNETLTNADEVQKIIRETKDNMENITPAEYTRFETFLPKKIDEIRFVNNIVHIGLQRDIIVDEIKISKKIEGGANGNIATGAGIATGVSKVFSMNQLSDETTANPSSANNVSRGVFSAHNVSFSIIATYPVTLLFLGDLERSLGLINVNTLALEEYKDTSKNKKITGSSVPLYRSMIEVETYSL